MDRSYGYPGNPLSGLKYTKYIANSMGGKPKRGANAASAAAAADEDTITDDDNDASDDDEVSFEFQHINQGAVYRELWGGALKLEAAEKEGRLARSAARET